MQVSLPQEQDESFSQSLQFETFDKHADDEAFLGHWSLDIHEVSQPKINDKSYSPNTMNLVSPPAVACP